MKIYTVQCTRVGRSSFWNGQDYTSNLQSAKVGAHWVFPGENCWCQQMPESTNWKLLHTHTHTDAVPLHSEMLKGEGSWKEWHKMTVERNSTTSGSGKELKEWIAQWVPNSCSSPRSWGNQPEPSQKPTVLYNIKDCSPNGKLCANQKIGNHWSSFITPPQLSPP